MKGTWKVIQQLLIVLRSQIPEISPNGPPCPVICVVFKFLTPKE
jgi:hypothetical protein